MEYWFSVHEIASLAAEMESKGVAFYKRLQQVAGDAKIADMCAFFAEQEEEHRAKFRTIAEAHRASSGSQQCYSVDICGMLRTSMRDLERLLESEPSGARNSTPVSDTLAIAAKVEATSISAYTEMKETYTGTFAGVLGAVLEEERKHLQMIQHVRERLRPRCLSTPLARVGRSGSPERRTV